MAGFTFPVANITAGVSTQEYSLRAPGQASAQVNCMNSPRYGLMKRPNSRWLTGIADTSAVDPITIPLYHGGAEKIFLANAGTTDPIVISKNGTKTDVAVFPASSSAATKATTYLTLATSSNTSFASVGDVTFISNKAKEPQMTSATWDGYTETVTAADDSGTVTVTNSDVFTASVNTVDPNQDTRYAVLFSEDRGGTVSEYSAWCANKFSSAAAAPVADSLYAQIGGSGSGTTFSTRDVVPEIPHIAATLGYYLSSLQNGSSEFMVEATSLVPTSYSDSTNDVTEDDESKGTGVVTARYINHENGSLAAVSATSGLTEEAITVTRENAESVAKLPSRSWKDHTVKISAEKESPRGFYMRFASDDTSAASHSNAGPGGSPDRPRFTATTNLPRDGHWEEYCGVGVTTTPDATTLPHLLVRRPDGTFAFMEARGSFVINSSAGVTFNSGGGYFTVDTVDGGFNDSSTVAPLVVGDTIEFPVGGTNFPTTLTTDKMYYIVSSSYVGGAWQYKVSDSREGTAIALTGGGSAGTCEVKLTTYDKLEYKDRLSGDDETNKLPDFFSNPIVSMFSFQDRIGFVTENEVAMSGTGDYFNFFRTTVRSVLDSDRILASPLQADGETLQHAIPYKGGLFLITSHSQLILAGEGGALSPRTVSITQATRGTTDFNTRPVVVGDYLMMPYTNESGTGFYQVGPSTRYQNQFELEDISRQIPGYLPQGPRRIQGSPKHNMLFVLDDGTGLGSLPATEQEKIYVYQWFETPQGRGQSAWTKWEFNEGNTNAAAQYKILDIVFIVDRLYMIVETNGSIELEYIDLDASVTDSELPDTIEDNFDVALLDRATVLDPSSDASLDGSDTVITLPWKYSSIASNHQDSIEVIAIAGSTATIYKELQVSTGSPYNTVTVLGNNLTGADHIIVGFGYTMTHTFGPFAPSVGDRPVRGRNSFVRAGRLTFSKLNKVTLDVVHGGTTYTHTIDAGGTSTTSGEEYFGISQRLEELSVSLKNDLPWQSMFQGISYDMNIQEGVQEPIWHR